MLVNPQMINYMSKIANNYGGNYLEIGCYDGLTLSAMAESLKPRVCYGIDPFLGDVAVCPDMSRSDSIDGNFIPMPEQRRNLYENISGHPNVSFYETTAEQFMNQRSQQELDDLNVTTVFVDGCHHTEYVKIDCMLSLLLIGRKKGAIIFDDMENEEVRNVVFELMQFLEKHSFDFRPLGAFAIMPEELVSDLRSLQSEKIEFNAASIDKTLRAPSGAVVVAAALEIN